VCPPLLLPARVCNRPVSHLSKPAPRKSNITQLTYNTCPKICSLKPRDEKPIIDQLYSLVSKSSGARYAESRYQCRIINEVNFSNGEIELMRNVSNSGCGIRVLVDGCWGFTSTSNISTDALKNSLNEAISIAKLLSGNKKKRSRDWLK
jgi:hypothetical protein